jgi:hypothetical protein
VDRPRKRGSGRSVFATTTMWAPSSAARGAIAEPMSRLAPLMDSIISSRVITIRPQLTVEPIGEYLHFFVQGQPGMATPMFHDEFGGNACLF